jgi:hypothetical protein
MDEERVEREALYAEVWATPMSTLAGKYGVSDVFLRRVCTRLGIPCPPRGYWAKRKSGQRHEIPPLPKLQTGAPTQWRKGDVLSRNAKPEQTQDMPKSRSARRATIMGSLNSFTSGRVASDGYLKPIKRNLPDLVVTEQTLHRAASILMKIATQFRDLNHRISVACGEGGYTRKVIGDEEGRLKRSSFDINPWGPALPTLVFIDEIAIGLTVYEQTVDKEMVYLDGKYVPVHEARKLKPGLWDGIRKNRYMVTTGRAPSKRLCLRAYSPYYLVEWTQTWTEHSAGLAKQIDDIVESLITRSKSIAIELAEANRAAALEHARWEAEKAVAKARDERLAILKQREAALKELLNTIDSWSAGRKAEAFFKDIIARSTDMEAEARRALLAKVQDAQELLQGPDSVEALMAWISPPAAPPD